ncbi:MAG: radical SAM/SPASM domain-containing protein [Gemmatimonadales bacterium]
MTTAASLWYKRAYDAVNHRLQTVAGGRLADWCRPTWISLLLTERCNARCVHCDIWQNRGKEDGPTLDQWKTALTDLRRWLGPAHVCLTGGEALLVPHTIEVVRHAVDLGLIVEVLTHGYWGDQTRIEALARANPWRITVSLDGLGPTHSKVRGREGFFERTRQSLETMTRLRRDEGLGYSILLKTVVMRHNVDQLEPLASFAKSEGMEIFYQPIEQNYNTAEDLDWFEQSDNWPDDRSQVVAAVQRLIELKRRGFPIANGFRQLEVMIPYFQDPRASQVEVRQHTAHHPHRACSALGLLQVQSNGDVSVCVSAPPVGNIKTRSPREIWNNRPKWWRGGCCLERFGDTGVPLPPPTEASSREARLP